MDQSARSKTRGHGYGRPDLALTLLSWESDSGTSLSHSSSVDLTEIHPNSQSTRGAETAKTNYGTWQARPPNSRTDPARPTTTKSIPQKKSRTKAARSTPKILRMTEDSSETRRRNP